jgi:preprotein translocase subunit SecE
LARNRKRAKDRRSRRPTGAGGRPGLATARLDEEATPDPIEHATPDVELAEAQLAVGRPQPDEEPDARDEPEAEAELTDEALELDADGGAGSREPPPLETAVGSAGTAGPSAHPRGRLIGFLLGSWRELQRVQWPDRSQVAQATGVVIGFVIVAGLFLWAADILAGHIVTYIINGHW